MQKVAVLLTVHNSLEQTLDCLRNCYQQIDSMKGDGTYSFTVYLVNDGCTDGTAEAVEENFPQTRIVRGSGTLYWNLGMHAAWEEAAKDAPDFYLWTNVRTRMKEGALACLMETSMFLRHKAIVAGTAEDSSGELSYGGRNKSGKIVEPDPAIPVPCYTFDGKLVLVPSHVYRILGNLDIHYQHSYGDIDYGVRAFKANVVRVVAPGVLCTCDRSEHVQKWRDRSCSLHDRIAYLYAPDGRPPHQQFIYDCRSQGFVYAVVHGISVAIKVFFPKKMK